MTDWNRPDSSKALRPWLLIDPLSLFQAVMLIFGRDPSHDLTGRPQGFVPIMTALTQAIERGEVPAGLTPDTDNGDFFSLDHEDRAYVKQTDIRAWLKTINYTDAFFFMTDPSAWPDASEPMLETTHNSDMPVELRERDSLLRIIRALDVMAGLPQRGPTPSVERQLQELGFTKPKEATIRKLLSEARALAQDSKPQ